MTTPTTEPDEVREPTEHSDRLRALAEAHDSAGLEAYVEGLSPGDAARAMSRLTAEQRDEVLTTLSPRDAADLLENLPDAQAADLLEHLPPAQAAAIVDQMRSDEQVDLLDEVERERAEAILARMTPEEAADVRRLRQYPPDSAGGLMITEYLAFREDATAGEVIDELGRRRELADVEVQYLYVIDARDRLVGVLRLRDLLFSPRDWPIARIMIRDPLSVPVETDLDALREFFEQHDFVGVPVVDADGRLVGVVHREAVEQALAERADADSLKRQGIVTGEELRTMPVFERARRRLAWLSVNIVLNVIAASVIAFYQDTLSAVIALAVFLPIISDMSGCSGNQAVAVSLRELSLGLIRPRDFWHVVWHEVRVGLLNGLALGALIALVAWLWKGNAWLGFVVGAALAVNTVVAVLIGGTIPLILRALKKDPALASGPILTTVTDMCGFFLVLGLASLMLPYLQQA